MKFTAAVGTAIAMLAASAPFAVAGEVGTSIIVAGQPFDVGHTVVLWNDPERGFNGYETHCIGAHATGGCCDVESPRYGERKGMKSRSVAELQKVVSQFVLHFDGCVNSRSCFHSMHNRVRPGGGKGCGLSAHFMVDADGTIYQTLDLAERAFHAEQSNGISVGVEICNRGKVNTAEWPKLPVEYRTRPSRHIEINGASFHAYDFRPEQYDALVGLTRTLLRIFPRIKPVFPERDGKPLLESLPDPTAFEGIVGHLHVDKDRQKWDPGALDWVRLMRGLSGFSLPVQVRTFIELPRGADELAAARRAAYANAEERASGFFPLAPGRLWHTGVNLRSTPGARVGAVTRGRIVAARRGRQDGVATSFVLTKHDVDVAGQRIEFFTLLGFLDLPPVTPDAPVPWVQRLSHKDRADVRADYEAGRILLLDERVEKDEPLGLVGLAARGPEQGPEIHFQTFTVDRLPDGFGGFRYLNAAADGAIARRADLVSLLDDNGDGQVDTRELGQLFRRGDMDRRHALRKLAVRHLHEWGDRAAAEVLAGPRELGALSPDDRKRLHDVAIAPYVFLTEDVARHTGLPTNQIVYSYHPVTFLFELGARTNGAQLSLPGGRVLSDRGLEPRRVPFPLADWTAAPTRATFTPLFGPPIGVRLAPRRRDDIPLIELPPTDER